MIKKILGILAIFGAVVGMMVSLALAGTGTIRVQIKGMLCSSCAKKMESKFKAQNGVEKVAVNLKKGLLELTMKSGRDLTDDQIKTLVNDPDYSVASIQRK